MRESFVRRFRLVVGGLFVLATAASCVTIGVIVLGPGVGVVTSGIAGGVVLAAVVLANGD